MKPEGFDEEIEKKLEWLRKTMEITNLKASPLAKAGGISASTLTRFLKEPYNSRIPRDNTLDMMAINLGIPTFTGIDASENIQSFKEDGAEPLSPDKIEADTELYNILQYHNNENTTQHNYWVMKGRALENVKINDGDILIVDCERVAQPNDLVCISLRDEAKGTAKTIFRQMIDNDLLSVAISASNDEHLSPKMVIIDGNKAVIYGVVSMVVRNY